jgi:hypothetical protein
VRCSRPVPPEKVLAGYARIGIAYEAVAKSPDKLEARRITDEKTMDYALRRTL